jgi:hypothetical protein
MRAKLAALIALTLLPGCTWTMLRQQSVEYSGAGADLRYRETIENLAMIYADRWRLPAYSSIYAGSMDVSDSIQMGGSTNWIHSQNAANGFLSQTLDVPGSRAVRGSFTLDPMIAPEKLRALRAVCQWAVYGSQGVVPDSDILRKYQPQFPPGNYFGVEDDLNKLSYCNWLGKGCRGRDVPKNACYWAHCGNAYVWVCPEGMDSFSQFVLVCQKIARTDVNTLWKPLIGTKTVKWSSGDLNNPRLQQVTAYVDDYGNLALGQNLPALPPKLRNDNVGQQADLKAAINASITVP